jgi:hypothetical protein
VLLILLPEVYMEYSRCGFIITYGVLLMLLPEVYMEYSRCGF